MQSPSTHWLLSKQGPDASPQTVASCDAVSNPQAPFVHFGVLHPVPPVHSESRVQLTPVLVLVVPVAVDGAPPAEVTLAAPPTPSSERPSRGREHPWIAPIAAAAIARITGEVRIVRA
jgi:hypothetical protein